MPSRSPDAELVQPFAERLAPLTGTDVNPVDREDMGDRGTNDSLLVVRQGHEESLEGVSVVLN